MHYSSRVIILICFAQKLELVASEMSYKRGKLVEFHREYKYSGVQILWSTNTLEYKYFGVKILYSKNTLSNDTRK